MVHQDEQLAHERIQGTFHRFGDTITKYHGHVRKLRGDVLLAEFERASDAVTAVIAFQADQAGRNIVVIHLRIIAVQMRICDASGIFD
jgi:class 3 adenylate cyclase